MGRHNPLRKRIVTITVWASERGSGGTAKGKGVSLHGPAGTDPLGKVAHPEWSVPCKRFTLLPDPTLRPASRPD